MPGFTQLIKTIFTDYKSDGKKLKVLQEKVPELQEAVNLIDDEYKSADLAEKTRAEGVEATLTTNLEAQITAYTANKTLTDEEIAKNKTDINNRVLEQETKQAGDKATADTDRALIRTELASAVEVEKTRAEGTEALLNTSIATLSVTQAGDKASADTDRALIRTEFATADSALSDRITLLETDSTTATSVAAVNTRVTELEASVNADFDAMQESLDTVESDLKQADTEIRQATFGFKQSTWAGDGTLKYDASGAKYPPIVNFDGSIADHLFHVDSQVFKHNKLIGNTHSDERLAFTPAFNTPSYLREDQEEKSTIAEDVTSALQNIANHAKDADVALTGRIADQEGKQVTDDANAATDRANIRTELEDAVGEERVRAEGIEQGLRTDLDAQVTKQASEKATADADRTSIRTEFAEAVAVEKSRAESAEADLQTNLTTQVSKQAGDKSAADTDRALIRTEFASAVAVEKSRAESAESALSTRVDNILSNSDPAQIDSLSEMLTAFQSADGDLLATINSLTTSTTNSFDAVNADLIAKDTAVRADFAAGDAGVVAYVDANMLAIGTTANHLKDHFDRKEHAYNSTQVHKTGVLKHAIEPHVMKWDQNYSDLSDGSVSGLANQKRTIRHMGHLYCPEGYKMKVHYDDGSVNKAYEEFEFGQSIDNQFEHTMEFHFGNAKTAGDAIPFAMADRFKTMGNTMLEQWGRITELEFAHTGGMIDGVYLNVHYEFILDGTVTNPTEVPYFKLYSREQTIDFHGQKDHTQEYFA